MSIQLTATALMLADNKPDVSFTPLCVSVVTVVRASKMCILVCCFLYGNTKARLRTISGAENIKKKKGRRRKTRYLML